MEWGGKGGVGGSERNQIFAQQYASQDLTALVDLEADYDIVAVGVQECNYKPAGGGSCEAHWFGCLEAFLGEHYHRVGGQSMWGIRLIVFIKAELYQVCRDADLGVPVPCLCACF